MLIEGESLAIEEDLGGEGRGERGRSVGVCGGFADDEHTSEVFEDAAWDTVSR